MHYIVLSAVDLLVTWTKLISQDVGNVQQTNRETAYQSIFLISVTFGIYRSTDFVMSNFTHVVGQNILLM